MRHGKRLEIIVSVWYTLQMMRCFCQDTGLFRKIPCQEITPVSTIGAGDNFNAGMITSIYHKSIKRDQLEKLTENEWSEVIETAVAFATHVCLSYENYISPEFADE